jgi:DNA-binding CsgD family transcriptional regulator
MATERLDAGLVGRESELAVLGEFLDGKRFPRALVLAGESGIGKTALWEAGIAAARERGIRVLSARASGAEAQPSLAGLIDLLDGVDLDEVAGLPRPQRRALEVALLRADPAGGHSAPGAIPLAVLNVLRALASSGSVLIAVDDVPWLDTASGEALAFAVARLGTEHVRFLLTRRPDGAARLEQALDRNLERLEIAPLSLGGIRRLLSERLGLTLPRYALRRLADATLCNPLFALELGRTLVGRPPLRAGEDVYVSHSLEDLLGTRVEALSPQVRRVLLAVALDAGLGTAQLAEIADATAVEQAVDSGVLVVEGADVRPSHPLVAAAARSRSSAPERRELHLELARVVDDPDLRARHLVLASSGPDAELAASVAAAAAGALARGACLAAVELGEHALRITPPGSPERAGRVLALCESLDAAGHLQRLMAVLSSELEELPPGPMRARAHLLLSSGPADTDESLSHLDLAYQESIDDPSLRAVVLATRTMDVAVGLVERIRDAEAWAEEAFSLAGASGGEPDPVTLEALAWIRVLRGRGFDDLERRFPDVVARPVELYHSLSRLTGIRRAFRGELGQARSVFRHLLALADERGEEWSFQTLTLQLCELELRAGSWDVAAALLDDWQPSADDGINWPDSHARCRALLAAGRGLAGEAESLAATTIASCESAGMRWNLLEAQRARGIAALLAHDPGRGAESLRAVWAHTQQEGIDEPGAFPVAPELVEALVELTELDEARAVTSRLVELAEAQQHPWGLAMAKRCRALVRLADAHDDASVATLAEAAVDCGRLGLRFDHARSLLLLGRAQRRGRKWAGARHALGQAAAAFEELGSPGWVEEARSELARVGARRPRPTGELTPAEERVARLAADGLANKEIARVVHVTVKTVEVHLSHAYAKLGVRSRTQLARRLSSQP